MIDNKAVCDVFQEIMLEFSDMKPANLDELESKTLDAIYKLGSYLMVCALAIASHGTV